MSRPAMRLSHGPLSKMTKRVSVQPPASFALSNYARLGKLDASGWYKEITRLHQLSLKHDLRLHKVDRNIIVLPNNGGIGQIAGPFAKFVVNVSKPDAIIKADFELWLQEVRKIIKPTVSKPGRPALNSKFDKSVFDRWRSAKIVEFADLLAWRATLDPATQKICRKIDLGKLVGRMTPKDIHTTEAILKRALASMPSLLGQVEHETSQSKSSRNQIAAGIRRDIAR